MKFNERVKTLCAKKRYYNNFMLCAGYFTEEEGTAPSNED